MSPEGAGAAGLTGGNNGAAYRRARRPVLQWLGTSGFRLVAGGTVILIDPFLTRNRRATPVQELRAADMSDADRVFVSHGHQDHLRDVPAIVAVSGAMVYCSAVAARTLKRKGVPRDRVRLLADGESLGFDGCGVRVAECEHSKTDLELMLRTAPRLLRLVPRLLVETVTMSSGPLLVFTFDLGGLSIMHMGSLCRSVSRLSEGVGGHDRPAPPDILLIPLRGRSDIGRLAAEAAAAIKPRAVVPQHHDNFLPPLSPPVDVESFRSLLAGMMPGCIYYEPTMNLEFDESDVFGAR